MVSAPLPNSEIVSVSLFSFRVTDLVISKIFGVEPQENGEIRIRPMLPDEWSYCRLEKIKCQGKDLSIIYDKTGEKYHQEKGFQIWCDEECIHKSLYPDEVSF